MKKTLTIVCAAALALMLFTFVCHAQILEKGAKNTITLPNGDVIWDLNGEWDTFVENYGPGASGTKYPQLNNITQTGSSFRSIRMMDDPYNKKGSQSLQGELDKTGFKQVTIITSLFGPFEAKGKISDEGNMLIIDDGLHRVTLTRK